MQQRSVEFQTCKVSDFGLKFCCVRNKYFVVVVICIFKLFFSLEVIGCLETGVNIQRGAIKRIGCHCVKKGLWVYVGVSKINCGICKLCLIVLLLSAYN